MTAVAAYLALALACVGVGLGLGRLCRIDVPAPLLGRIALAHTVGAVGLGAAATVLAAAGGPVEPWVAVVAGGAYPVLRLKEVVGPGRPTIATPRTGRVERCLLVGLLALGALVVAAAAVRPLMEIDGWEIWGLKAFALFADGDARGPVFHGIAYTPSHPEYPLLVPGLEALGLGFLGRFDVALVDVPLATVSVSAAVSLWAVLRLRVSGWLAGAVPLAMLGLPATWEELGRNHVDVLLAFLVALGVLCLAVAIDDGDPALARLASVALVGAALTKNEGQLLAVAALATALVFAPTRAVRRKVLAISTPVLAAVVGWAAVLAVRDVETVDFQLGDAVDLRFLSDRSDRVGTAAVRLLTETFSLWLILSLFALAAVAAGLVAGVVRTAGFCLCWCALSLAGFTWIYWISRWPLQEHLDSSATRLVTSVVFGAVAIAPLLLEPALAGAKRARIELYFRAD